MPFARRSDRPRQGSASDRQHEADGRGCPVHALTYAGEHHPYLVLDFATLTARRASPGAPTCRRCSPTTTRGQRLVRRRSARATRCAMPLWRPTRYLNSVIADMATRFAHGLRRHRCAVPGSFVHYSRMANLDVYRGSDRIARPAGRRANAGVALGLRDAEDTLRPTVGWAPAHHCHLSAPTAQERIEHAAPAIPPTPMPRCWTQRRARARPTASPSAGPAGTPLCGCPRPACRWPRRGNCARCHARG